MSHERQQKTARGCPSITLSSRCSLTTHQLGLDEGVRVVAGSVLFSKVSVVARSQEESLFYANPCIYGGMGVGGGRWGVVEQSGHVAPGRQAE